MNKFLLLFLFSPLFAFTQHTIIGGNQIPIEAAPYIVSVTDWTPFQGNQGPATRGAGVILSEKWILTATHILDRGGGVFITPNNLQIYAGSAAIGPHSQGQTRIATNISILDIDYTNTPSGAYKNDLALIEINPPLVFNEQVQPIEFANPCNTTLPDLALGIIAFLSGWGKTCVPCPLSPTLNATNMPIISTAAANQVHMNSSISNTAITDSMLAFYDPPQNGHAGTTSYSGDSGGPAIIDKNGNEILIGNTSWSFRPNGISPTQLPVMYMKTLTYYNWIQSITGLHLNPTGVDLYTKDKEWDMAQEPFYCNAPWTSDDIWVRNQNDNIEIHEPPEYSTGANPNYIKVRVTNNGCTASAGNELLKVYWAKAATALSWPTHWNGSLSVGGQSLGDIIGTVNLPVIQPGDAYIATVAWLPPNPDTFAALYSGNSTVFKADEPHHFCLLSRIEAQSDPMTVPETNDVCHNTIQNNNIAWKNISVVNVDPTNIVSGTTVDDRPMGANVFVGGMGNSEEDFDLSVCETPYAGEFNVTDFAEVKITLDSLLWLKWEATEFSSENITIVNEAKHQITMVEGCGTIKDLNFSGFDQYLMHTSFNFLTDDISEESNFHFTIAQKRSADQSLVGGETFEIRVPNRLDFDADAGDNVSIEKGDQVTLSALQIGENAIYNWYNEVGELVYTGQSFSLSPEVSQTYQLEVIATLDGFKDYDEVEIQVKIEKIISCSPNPAATFIDVHYTVENSSSAYFVLVKHLDNVSSQFMIDPQLENIQLDISNFQSGNYSLILVSNGEVKDHTNILIQ